MKGWGGRAPRELDSPLELVELGDEGDLLTLELEGLLCQPRHLHTVLLAAPEQLKDLCRSVAGVSTHAKRPHTG
eukprot:2682344-Prymnesium_polylepis.3